MPPHTLSPYTTLFRSQYQYKSKHLYHYGTKYSFPTQRSSDLTGVIAPARRPEIKTELPGPKGKKIIEADARFVNPDRKSTSLNSSHGYISYAACCLTKRR